MKEEIKQAFSGLEESLRRIETLSAWRELERAEFRVDSPLRLNHDSTIQEFRLEEGRFWIRVAEAQRSIDSLPRNARMSARRRLARLIAQCRNLSESTGERIR